ncbi:MAG: DNRLRE domain-containing protein [Thermoanaerobaculia bacterium]|nr:DNRLRE domain-containing protein [Thermoanaerobaculia bacterium]
MHTRFRRHRDADGIQRQHSLRRRRGRFVQRRRRVPLRRQDQRRSDSQGGARLRRRRGRPAGAQITRARLDASNDPRPSPGTTAVELRRLNADWGEGSSNAPSEEGAGVAATTGDATWLHRFFNTSNWATAGGDFAGTVSASTNVAGSGGYTWGSTAQMVADVQGWLDTPASNFGWLARGDESTFPTAKRFNSRENAGATTVPMLEIVYLQSIFADGFESGDTSGWTSTLPP